MLYEATPENLRSLVRTANTLEREQVIRFFSDAVDGFNVPYYINQAIAKRVFDYDEAKDTIRWHTAPKITDSEIKNRIRAFWIIASFRSRNVREINLMPYPSQFLFITHENEVYDLTVCYSKMDANLAARNRKLYQFEGVEDEVNHIAIVPNEVVGKDIAPFGFDSFCVYDQDHVPRYSTWN